MARLLKPGVQEYGDSFTKLGGGFDGFVPSTYAELDAATPDTIVAEDVLQRFNIPYNAPTDLLGRVPGFDIRNMAPFEAIRLSLAENYKNRKLVEVFMNANGIAEFIVIGENSFSPSVDPILTSKSIVPDLRGDLVVIRSFDFPPERRIATERGFYLLKTPGAPGEARVVQVIDPSNSANNDTALEPVGFSSTNIATAVNKRASVIYYDPAFDSAYKDDIAIAYNAQCFESLIAWRHLINWNIPHGLDKDATIEFSNSAAMSVPLTNVGTGSLDDEDGYFTYTFTTSDAVTDILVRENHYGEPFSAFQDINSLLLYGYRVSSIAASATTGGVIVTYAAELTTAGAGIFHTLSEGSDYTWDYSTPGDGSTSLVSPTIKVFNSREVLAKHPDVTGTITYRANLGVGAGSDVPLAGAGSYLPVGTGLGYLAAGIFANITVNVPSINIFSPAGQAKEIAEALVEDGFVRVDPVIIYDPPAPVYYRFRDGEDTNGLDQAGFIDHAADLVDADPTTLQDLDSTPSKRLQDSSTGNTIDVSFPFIFDGKIVETPDGDCDPASTGFSATDDEITAIRDFIFDLYNNSVDGGVAESGNYTFQGSIVNGTLPRLGDSYDGAIINEISYNFQDASSFQVNISTGHIVSNLGSWGTNIYQRQTEDVSREGTVTQVSGNGALYAVKVWRLGVYSAVSSVLDEVEVGDRVSVTISNLLSEQ